ncbi:MAG: multiprotein bridging factor aMBF1 [Candidatus Bathyarchaeota archaeon]|nr:multiprotein bridging factor aMBF1 [Candidatus Bathyarchaeota archaeon]
MRCEVCGRKIHDEPVRAVIEGAKLTVCLECSKHGKVILHEVADFPAPQKTTTSTYTSSSSTKSTMHLPVILKKPPVAQVQLTTELTEGYASKIRIAREKLALSHEDLGKKINEKASLLRHIETGKVAPNNQLASKLEHALRIQLMVPIADEKSTTQVHRAAANEEMTLGDLIDLDKKSGEEPTKRKQS